MSSHWASFRYLVLGAIAATSVYTAWSIGLGYLFSGAWVRSPAIAFAAAFLPIYFALAWTLVPATNNALVILLWSLSVIAFAICGSASTSMIDFPIKLRATDIAVALGIPIAAAVYRGLLTLRTRVRH